MQHLIVRCCQIVGQILQSGGLPTEESTINNVFSSLLHSVVYVVDSNKSSNKLSEFAQSGDRLILLVICILLYQSTVSYSNLLDADQNHQSFYSVKKNVYDTIHKLFISSLITNSALEVYVILICTLDFIDSNSIAISLVSQFTELHSKFQSLTAEINTNLNFISLHQFELEQMIGI
jgi:hypothetical protein